VVARRSTTAGTTQRGRWCASVLAACSLTVTASCTAENSCPAIGTPSTLEVRLAAAWPERGTWDVDVVCDEPAGCSVLDDTPGPDRQVTVGDPDEAQTVEVSVRDRSSGKIAHVGDHEVAWSTTTQPGRCGATYSTGVVVLDVRHAST